MKDTALLVIDMQNGFLNERSPLYIVIGCLIAGSSALTSPEVSTPTTTATSSIICR